MSADAWAEDRYAEAVKEQRFRASNGVPIRELVALVCDNGIDLVWLEIVRNVP